jgi:hypothetical protein
MPNRVVREGIIDSPRIEQLVREVGWAGEVFYRRLHQIVDDYGRFDGRLTMLKARAFPTVMDLVRDADLERWIAACVKSGLVRVYEVKGHRYLELLDFRQQVRAKTSKYPDPPQSDADDQHSLSMRETHAQQTLCARDAPAQQMLSTCAADAHLDEDEVEDVVEGASNKGGAEQKQLVVLSPASPSPVLPFESEEFRQAWSDFVSMRKEIKKPLRPTATKAMLKKLQAAGEQLAIEALRESTANQWQGVFLQKGGNHGSGASRAASLFEREQQREQQQLNVIAKWASERSLPAR